MVVPGGERGGGRLGVGGDRDGGGGIVWNGDSDAWARARRCAWNCAEMLLDHRFDLRDVEIADGDDRHQIGSIPILIEATKHLRLRLLNADIVANRKYRPILGILDSYRD